MITQNALMRPKTRLVTALLRDAGPRVWLKGHGPA